MINVTQFLWVPLTETFDGTLRARTGPAEVRPSANLFGLRSQEIRKANEKFTNRKGSDSSLGSNIKIPFQYIKEIPSWSKGATYSEENVMGRYEPLYMYSYSNGQSFKLDLIYHAQSETNGVWSLENIERTIIPPLKSLTYPQYDGNFSPPQPMLLNIGTEWMDVPIIIMDVSITAKGPFHYDGFKSHIREVSLDCRVAHPIYQAISQQSIIDAGDNSVFAKKQFAMPGLPAQPGQQKKSTIPTVEFTMPGRPVNLAPPAPQKKLTIPIVKFT